VKDVYCPESHIWGYLKRPKKGTCCEICRATENLRAYRGPYMKQTVCNSCLEKAKRKAKKKEKRYERKRKRTRT
jgi:hypothetical protein